MDLQMPVMDGFEACRRLKEDPGTADIPVIMISSSCTSDIVERGFEVGAIEFFAKPFKSGRLAEFVNTLIEARKIRKKEKVLVVEDSGTTRHIFKYLFTKNGFETFVAKDADTALARLPEYRPDLILTDCYMPKKSGFEFTREVKRMEQFRHVPIIMVTAAKKREDVLEGLAAGANDYITKPFDEAELIARIDVHLLNKSLFDKVALERDKLERMFEKQGRLLHEITVLNNMGQELQRCQNEEETYAIIVNSLQQIFPNDSGVLFICDSMGETCKAVAGWGAGTAGLQECIKVDACFSWSKERVYELKQNEGIIECSHCTGYPEERFLCIPLVSRGSLQGLIRLRPKMEMQAGKQHEKWHLLLSTAEHISLAITNLRLQESLRYQSIRDPLTGLFNRRYMEESLAREMSRVRRAKGSLGVIMLDIDYFKAFNDMFGHAAGDEVLKEVGALLQKSIRAADIVCRYGGEEFMVIMPDASQEVVVERAQQIRAMVEKDIVFEFDGERQSVTLSAGVAIYPVHGELIDAMIACADAALYQAKRAGRNRVVLAEKSFIP